MTLILAHKTKSGSVYMAGDRYEGEGYNFQHCPRSKISIKNKEDNPILIGCAGDSWGCTILVDMLRWPKLDRNEDGYFYLKNKALIEIRKEFKHLGADKLEGEDAIVVKGLIVLNRQIYQFDVKNMSLASAVLCDNIGAVGAGDIEGLAALNVLNKVAPELSPKKRLLYAMEITASMNNVVNPPFDVLKV